MPLWLTTTFQQLQCLIKQSWGSGLGGHSLGTVKEGHDIHKHEELRAASKGVNRRFPILKGHTKLNVLPKWNKANSRSIKTNPSQQPSSMAWSFKAKWVSIISDSTQEFHQMLAYKVAIYLQVSLMFLKFHLRNSVETKLQGRRARSN